MLTIVFIPQYRCIQLNTVFHAVRPGTKVQRMQQDTETMALEQSQESLVLQSIQCDHLKYFTSYYSFESFNSSNQLIKEIEFAAIEPNKAHSIEREKNYSVILYI